MAELAPWKPRHNPWLVTLSVMLATFMEVLDTSIANVALPHIAGSMSATVDEATWVLTSYLVSNAIVLATASWLSRRFGRKRYLAFSVALFVVSSALCGMAQTLPQLIIARVLQGIGGGGLQPLVQAVLLESFPPEKRGMAMAAYGMGVVVAPILGPTLGGWITDNYSWRWVFYINLPIGMLGLILQQMFLEDPPYISQAKVGRIDYIGFGSMAVGVALLQVVLDKGQQLDWFGSQFIVWSLAGAVAALLFFVIWELNHDDPIMHLRLLKNRNFATATVVMGIVAAALYGTTTILPIFMETLMGYTAYVAGLAMTPRGIGSFCSMILIGRLMQRIENRLLMAIGFLGVATACALLSRLTLDIMPSDIVWPLVLNGLALGFIFVPLTTFSVATLKQEQINQATSIYSLLRNLGAGIGISILVAMQQRLAQHHQVDLIAHLTPYDPEFSRRLALLSHRLGQRRALAVIYEQAAAQARLLSFDDLFRAIAAIYIVCTPLVFLFQKGHKPAGQHVAME